MEDNTKAFIAVMVILSTAIFFGVTNTIDFNNKKIYCIEQGYDGVQDRVSNGHRCYREVQHESGVGIETIYSGEITSEHKKSQKGE